MKKLFSPTVVTSVLATLGSVWALNNIKELRPVRDALGL